MPSKYYFRNFAKGHYYHIYNRGAHKRKIFRDKRDYQTFVEILEYYLKFPTGKPLSYLPRLKIKVPNLDSESAPIKLIAYCLMPNHFHFLLKQNSHPTPKTSITNLMRRLSITYVLYFNERHQHSGNIYQGKYKSILIETESHLLHLTRYIHLNPLDLAPRSTSAPYKWITKYKHSSYQNYLNPKKPTFTKPQTILDYFNSTQSSPDFNNINSYRSFVESYKNNPQSILKDLTLEDNN